MDVSPQPAAEHQPLPEGMICPECAYDLRGLTSERCPECGEDLGILHRREPLIPWEHREDLGFVRAYLATMASVFWRSEKFCRAMATPVSHQRAASFRFITTCILSISLALILLPLFLIVDLENQLQTSSLRWGIFIGWLTFSLCAYWVPGLLSHAFQSKLLTIRQQDRAVSISLYICCTFLLVIVPAILCVIAAAILNDAIDIHETNALVLLIVAVAWIGGVGFALANRLETFMRHMLREPLIIRLGRLAWYVALGGLLSCSFLLASASILYLAIILESLR
jgi:hypothetical protein